MAYLQKSDYVLSTAITHLDDILAQAADTSGLTADEVRLKHEVLAQSKIQVYLGAKYQITGEFAKDATNTSRDPIIVSLAVDLALCSLHNTINPRDIPEHIENNCKAAMSLLSDIRDGKSGVITVPVLSTQMYVSRIDSQQKFVSKEFVDKSIISPDSI